MNKDPRKERITPCGKGSVLSVSDFMNYAVHLADVRDQARQGYYDRPDVLRELAERLKKKLRKQPRPTKT
jgi:hypothetical protein